MSDLFEHEPEDLREMIVHEQREELRLKSEWEAGSIDGSTWARVLSACRLMRQWMLEALEIAEGRSQLTAAYDFKRRAALEAASRLGDWVGLDDELRRMLDDEGEL